MIYVMSDIHGDKSAFLSILKQIDLKKKDTLYVLGDILDRHEYGVEILQQIMGMDNVKCLLGNHELMCLNAIIPHSKDLPWTRSDPDQDFYRWIRNGGRETLRAIQKLSVDDCDALIGYLIALPTQYNIQVNGTEFKLVHASPREMCQAEELSTYYDEINFSVWKRIDDFSQVPNNCTIVFGHTPTIAYQNDHLLRIWYAPNAIGIDCGCGFDSTIGEGILHGRLACLRLDDMREYYSKI